MDPLFGYHHVPFYRRVTWAGLLSLLAPLLIVVLATGPIYWAGSDGTAVALPRGQCVAILVITALLMIGGMLLFVA